jgi:large subunit ribosomal protein L15
MNLHSLKPAEGSVHKEGKRLGRGEGSGKGGTAARGHKGAKSRSGYSKKIGFEGGQMPLQRRVPKFGFKNINRVDHQGVGLSKLQELADAGMTEITLETLVQKRVVSKNDKVKILANGSLNAKVSVTVHKFTAAAKAAIEAAGGTATSL